MPRGRGTPAATAALDDIAPTQNPRAGARVSGPDRMIEIQRARILAAMTDVSAERGAANVTVAHIVARAGVSRRTFYALYSDREACFLGAFDAAVARASRYVLDTYDPRAKWVERVRAALTAVLGFLDTERGAGQLLIVGSLGAGERALDRRRRAIVRMIELVEEGRTEARGGGELPPLTAEGVVGGVLSVLHARLLVPRNGRPRDGGHVPSDGQPASRNGKIEAGEGSLLALTGPLTGMIVLPYLGPAAARRELARPAPAPARSRHVGPADPLRDVAMRLTYRTMTVLTSVGAHPGSSNREIGLAAGMRDQGQISKLLTRLSKLGLIENGPAGQARGAPNAWMLTGKGREIERAIGERAGG